MIIQDILQSLLKHRSLHNHDFKIDQYISSFLKFP